MLKNISYREITCGQSFVDARAEIVGGTISQRGMWPWQIAIYRINKNGKVPISTHVCRVGELIIALG